MENRESGSSNPISKRNGPKASTASSDKVDPAKVSANEGSSNPSQTNTFQPYVPVTAGSNVLKRKRPEEDDPKLKEYLDVMQPARKAMPKREIHSERGVANTTSTTNLTITEGGNEEAERAAKKKRKEERREKRRLAEEAANAAASNGQPSDVRDQEVKQKKKKKKHSTEEPAATEESVQGLATGTEDSAKSNKKTSKSQDKSKGGVQPLDDDDTMELAADGNQRHVSATDADWLRSKTNRVLDLVDEDELSKWATNKKEIVSRNDPVDNNDTQSNTSTSSEDRPPIEIAEDVDNNGTNGDEAQTTNFNGRLFVRNLPYDATEPDLEKTFSKHGKLAEVRQKIFSKSQPRRMMIILIGTTYALHMMFSRNSILVDTFASEPFTAVYFLEKVVISVR